jgi:hypothetical protein
VLVVFQISIVILSLLSFASSLPCPEPRPSISFECDYEGYWFTSGDLIVTDAVSIDSDVQVRGSLTFLNNARYVHAAAQGASMNGTLTIST